jgi:hypothetical protein
MGHKVSRRWESKFARFVKAYGVALLAAALDIRPSAIFHWIGGRTSPRPANAFAMQKLAKRCNVELSLEDIYQHSREIRTGQLIDLGMEGRIFIGPGDMCRRTSTTYHAPLRETNILRLPRERKHSSARE